MSMNDKPDDAFDYQKHFENHSFGDSSVRSKVARERRHAARKHRISIRIDDDVLDEFKRLTPEGGYQALINNALRDWLAARSVKELVREEVRDALKEAAGGTV